VHELIAAALIRWGASQDQFFCFAMSQFDWSITPKKLKLWKLPKREGSILKRRIQWTVHSPHKTQLGKKDTSHHPQDKKREIWFLTQLPKMLTQYGIQVRAEDSR